MLEGVMMRGKINWAVAVRKADGEIYVEEHDLPAHRRIGWRTWPIMRGMWAMYETLALALQAFSISARYLSVGEPERDGGAAPHSEGSTGAEPEWGAGSEGGVAPEAQSATGESSEAEEAAAEGLTKGEIGLTMVFGVVLAIGIFIVLPAVVTTWVVGSSLKNPFLWNVFDGVLRLIVFFCYIWLVGLMPDISRVFAYHGAEHKTIHAYEHGVPLEPAYIQRYRTLHVRCGTSFLLMVMVVAILVFSLVPGRAILEAWGVTSPVAVVLFNICVRILLLPLVAGLAYEVTVKWAGSRPENPLVRVLLWPGMQLQRMTTREPDDRMVEVAVAALRAVEERERLEEASVAGPDVPVIAG